MNNKIVRGTFRVLYLIGWLVLALPVQAASFDCAKAATKVEKLICADDTLSKLDEKLAEAYSEAPKDEQDVALLKSQQRAWLKERNQCADISCLRDHYLQRIAKLNETESYTLVMSKDDELCNHMMELFNQDLKKYGWKGDGHQEEHEEFKRIPWQPARFSYLYPNNPNGKILYQPVEGALFDFNNDGIEDFVVRDIGSLSGMRADSLHVFDKDAAKRANELTSRELWDAKNQINLPGWWYDLSPPFEAIAGVRVLEPFIYRGISYLVMRPLFENLRTSAGNSVITKYGGGKFINRDATGKMEDICYFKRIGAKRVIY